MWKFAMRLEYHTANVAIGCDSSDNTCNYFNLPHTIHLSRLLKFDAFL